MTSGSAHQGSVWMEMDASTHYRLENNLSCDVCVVGAGIAGLSTAYLLTRAGYRVFVVDGGMIGGGETGRTTAHLTNVVDERFYRLEELYGESGAQIAAESHAAAIDKIEAIIAEEAADCDFERVDGYLFLGNGDTVETLDRELEAAHRAGLTKSERIPRIPVHSFDSGPALRFPEQAQFHPIKYVNALAHAIRLKGGKIFTRTHARQITGGSSARVMTSSGHSISADHIVVATNAPINDVVTIHAKQAAYRTYVIAAPIPEGLIQPALYWDTGEPYHYVRIVKAGDVASASPGKSHDLLIVGGEDHKTGQEDDPIDRYSRLESWMRFRFPMTGRIEHRWSGQILEPCDKTAFIGRNPGDEPNVYIITGQSGNGLTHGTIGGMIISDLIEGRQNSWAEYYDPSRVTARSLKEYAKENLNVVLQLNDWLTRGTVGSTEDITPGSGAVLRRGLHKVAVFRDERGEIHERSAVCPHLGCIVGWNKAEETWDCPCHGSRFDPYGTVINGPANRDLPATSTTDEHEEDSDHAIRAARGR